MTSSAQTRSLGEHTKWSRQEETTRGMFGCFFSSFLSVPVDSCPKFAALLNTDCNVCGQKHEHYASEILKTESYPVSIQDLFLTFSLQPTYYTLNPLWATFYSTGPQRSRSNSQSCIILKGFLAPKQQNCCSKSKKAK